MTDKIALVTGASRGLGFALARALAPSHHVIAVARTSGALEELDDLIKAKGGTATLAPMDITDDAAMQTLCRSIFDRWGKLDVWMHTAVHTSPLTPAHFIDAKDMAKAIATNITAVTRLIPYVTPLLGEDGTAMFFDDQMQGRRNFSTHGGTKAAQIAMVQSWQQETTRTGPRVLIETPPAMPTAARGQFFPGEDRSALADTGSVAADIVGRLDAE